ncbi:MAG: ABC transporter permease [Firmicutes bacterium HGW-Firmicutes-7]|nr:MAG: ABC transporter permease [Firmicutes bacterium HGW-Firmicutes-7]
MKNKKSKSYLLALLPFVIVIFFFEIIPLMMIVIRSFMPLGEIGFTVEHYFSIFSKRLYQQAVINSLIVALVSAFVGIFIAFFGAKAANSTSSRAKTFFMSVLNMTSNFAGIPLAFAYIIMFGNVGVFVMIGKQMGFTSLANLDLYTVWGLTLTYIYFQIPLATLLLIPAFEGIRKEWGEAVSLLGGNRIQFWIRVGIPVLLPSLFGTLSVLFANAIAAYATAYALLQNNFSLIPIRISEQFVGDVVQRREFGSALAVVLMLLMVLAVTMNNRMLKWAKGEGFYDKK